MERTSSERRLLAETSSYEQDMAAAAAAASTERADDNLGGKRKSPSPVRSISETVSPQFQTAERADFGGARTSGLGRGRHHRKPYDITSSPVAVAAGGGNLRRTTPRLSERFVNSSANGTHPTPSAASASRAGIGNGGEKEYLAAAGLQPYLGIHQILQMPPASSSSPPAGRGIVGKMNRSSFRRMVGRTARRSVASIGPAAGADAGAGKAPSSASAAPTRKPRQDSHEELTNDQQRGNSLVLSLLRFYSIDKKGWRARAFLYGGGRGVAS